MFLIIDKWTCEGIPEPLLAVTSGSNVDLYAFENPDTIKTSVIGPEAIVLEISYDIEMQLIFWCAFVPGGGGNAGIYRAHLNGSDLRRIVSAGKSNIAVGTLYSGFNDTSVKFKQELVSTTMELPPTGLGRSFTF